MTIAYHIQLIIIMPTYLPTYIHSAFAAVLWPSVPFTVPEEKVGLAYGLTTAIQNGGLALFPVLAAAIYKVGRFVLLVCLYKCMYVCMYLPDQPSSIIIIIITGGALDLHPECGGAVCGPGCRGRAMWALPQCLGCQVGR